MSCGGLLTDADFCFAADLIAGGGIRKESDFKAFALNWVDKFNLGVTVS